MNARPLLVLAVPIVTACAGSGPGEVELPVEVPSRAVCAPLAPAPDSSLLAHAPLWTLDSAPQLSADQERLLSIIRERPTTAEVHIARLSPAADSLLEAGNRIVLTVSPGRSVVALGERVTRRGPSDVSWSGAVQHAFGWVDLVLTSKGVTASLHSAGNGETESVVMASYGVEPIGGGLQALVCIDASKYPPD